MNKEETIKLIKDTKSWTYACAPLKICYCHGFTIGFLKAKRHYKEYLKEVFYPMGNGVGMQWTDTEQNYKNIEQLYNYPEQTDDYIKIWHQENKEFCYLSEKVIKAIPNMDDEELAEAFKDYIDHMSDAWARPLAMDIIGIYTETTLLNQFIESLPKDKKANAHELFSSLCNPSEISFMTAEQISLLRLALLYLGKDKSFEKELENHQQEYFWIECGYNLVKVLDKEYFRNKIKEEALKGVDAIRKELKIMLDRDSILANQKNMIKELKLPKSVVQDILMTQKLGIWQDRRKEFCLKSLYYQYVFMKEFCKRRNYSFEDIEQLSCREMIRYFSSKKQIPKDLVKSRKNLVIYAGQQPDNEIIFDGKDAEEINKAFEEKAKPKEDHVLKGLVASKGSSDTCKGIVRVILDPSKAVFKQGEILVASMTRPEYVPFMKKAKAIITDEGGVTSHAAIISRELGIPCIVGTRFATKLLKDNDGIEMDMSKGVIKRI